MQFVRGLLVLLLLSLPATATALAHPALIPLPTSVDEEHCKAEFHDGLLTIHLPKTREAAEAKKKIPINADTRH